MVGSDRTVTVRRDEGGPFAATVLAVDTPRDIALLSFVPASANLSPSAEPLVLGIVSTADNGRPLMLLGYSLAGVFADGSVGAAAAKAGVLSQIVDFGDSGLRLQMDAPADPGDSGSPVFDSDGLVVGMAVSAQVSTAGGQRVVGIFYAVHIDEIRAALPALKAGQSR